MERLKISVAPKGRRVKIGGSSETDATPVEGNATPTEGIEMSMLRDYENMVAENTIRMIDARDK